MSKNSHQKNNKRRLPKVLIIIENMSYTYDTRMRKIAHSLANAGWEVSVICPRYVDDPYVQNCNGIEVFFYPSLHRMPGFIGHLLEYTWSFFIISFLSLINFVTRGFDVVHVCNPPDIFFPIGWISHCLRRRFVFDQHDLCPELWDIRYGKWPLVHKLIVAAEKATASVADQILVTSETARQRLMKRTQTNESRITLVRNGPDLQSFPKTMEVPSHIGVEVGYIGDMNPQDGIDNLIKAAHFIHYSLGRSDIHFVCIGDGSVFNDCKKLISQLGLDDVVKFLGRLPPPQAMNRLALCDLCLQPDPKNAFTDSCIMVKSLEYMALSKPIVAFDLEETQRACGDAALYAKNNSIETFAREIIRLADDPELRKELGNRGRLRIEKTLSWSNAQRPLLATYERLAQGMNIGNLQ